MAPKLVIFTLSFLLISCGKNDPSIPTYVMTPTVYEGGMTIYTDRPYTEQLHPKILESSYLIKSSRHYTTPEEPNFSHNPHVHIASDKEFTVYVGIGDGTCNNNVDIIDSPAWKQLTINYQVPGTSCTFSTMYYLTFPAGELVLPKIATTAAPPIFVKSTGHVRAFFTL